MPWFLMIHFIVILYFIICLSDFSRKSKKLLSYGIVIIFFVIVVIYLAFWTLLFFVVWFHMVCLGTHWALFLDGPNTPAI